MKQMKTLKWLYILFSVLVIGLGVAILINPAISARTLCIIAGIMFIVFGAVRIISYFMQDVYGLAFQFGLGFGILSVLVGLVLLARPSKALAILPVLIGILLLVDGVFRIQTALEAKRFGLPQWGMILSLAIITIVLSVLLIWDPMVGALSITILLGITLIINGIQNLCVAIYTIKAMKEVQEVLS